MYYIVRHHGQGHVAAARKRSHQWCLTLTPNNTETTEKMTRPCFPWPIRRHLPSSYYTPKVFQSSKRKGSLQHSVDKEVSALARLTFYENLLIGQEKVSVVPIKLCPVKRHELYSFHPIPNPWRISVEHISITLSHTFIYQNIYKNSCLNTKYQKLKKKTTTTKKQDT